MGCAASVPGASDPPTLATCLPIAKQTAALLELFQLLGASTPPDVGVISTVIASAAEGLANGQRGLVLFADHIKNHLLYKQRVTDKELSRVDLSLVAENGSAKAILGRMLAQVVATGEAYCRAEALVDDIWPSSGAMGSDSIRSALAVPVKTVDAKVVGVILVLNRSTEVERRAEEGFSEEDQAAVATLGERVAPLIQKYGAEAGFSNLEAGNEEDEAVRSMLSNFGRGPKRDVKKLVKKKVRHLIMARRLSAPTVPTNGAGADAADAAKADAAQDVTAMCTWGMPVLQLEPERMASLAETAVADLGLLGSMNVPSGVFKAYTLATLAKYNPNPYHNAHHGFAVFQACYWALKTCKIVQECTTPLERLALLTAAVGHDAGHDGVNNAFHVKAYSDLSHLYNDQAPLENLHACTTYTVLRDESCNVFTGLDNEQWHEARGVLTDAIMHTDMGQHPRTVSVLSEKQEFDANKPADRKEMVSLVLHTMDLANVAYPWDQCVPWARNVGQEFAQQVAKERAAKMDVSAFMDVKNDFELAKLQVGFISFVIKPFFEKVAYHVTEFSEVVTIMQENVDRWKKVQAKEEEFVNLQDGALRPVAAAAAETTPES